MQLLDKRHSLGTNTPAQTCSTRLVNRPLLLCLLGLTMALHCVDQGQIILVHRLEGRGEVQHTQQQDSVFVSGRLANIRRRQNSESVQSCLA